MKLFLHIGTEKTGSSFLQYYLANNREMLKRQNIHYPHGGKHEVQMKEGQISPGNAFMLDKYISTGQWEKTENWLQNLYTSTADARCDKVLLSNEILVKTFSKPNKLEKFIKICKSLNFILQPMLLIIREPVNQALSLYKHRSKRGIMLPIKEWLEKKYSLAECLEGFYEYVEQLGNVNVKQYPYRKSSEYLIEVCMHEWLKLNEVIRIEHKEVNPSLTLSELKVLSEIQKKNSFLAVRFYNNMIKINPKLKADDTSYDANLRVQINNYMQKYNHLWEKCNSYMSAECSVYNYSIIDQKEKEPILNFSKIQIQEFAELMLQSNRLIFFVLKLKYDIKSFILRFLFNNS